MLLGQWLCRTCSMGQKPECVLCPNKGGAMKSTRSGQKWAHVSCALWIPEVSIGSVDRMEPITKISSIPQSRWALVCVLCRERVGACIQCSVKTCKTAYHVTCAFQHGLEMRAIIEDENAEDGVKLRSYCQKHSVKKEPKNSANAEKTLTGSASEEEGKVVTNKKKIRKEMTTEERNHARLARLVEIQSEFDKHVSVKDISCHLLDVDQEGINHIYNFWILKRKAGGNDPLLLPKAGDADVLSQTDQEQADIEKMKMFVHLRQDLERVRNLCYMVSRREKLSRSFFKIREQTFQKQISVLSSYKKTTKQDETSIKATMEANHAPSIYDVLYSCDSIKDSRVMKIEEMIDSILGNTSSKTKEINGNVKKDKIDAISRYSKLFNGGAINSSSVSNKKLNNIYDSLSSDTDGSNRRPTRRKSHMTSSSISASSASASSEDESPTRKSLVKPKTPLPPPSQPVTPTSQPKKKGRPPGSTKQAVAEKRKQMSAISAKDKTKSQTIDSSSEEDVKHVTRTKLKSPTISRNRNPTDDVHLTDESDELVPIRNSSGHSIPTTGNAKRILSSAIYSDSDSSTDKDNKTDHTVSDSQQQPFRTKAAMKEFNINDLLPFDKSKKITDVPDPKKSNTHAKKSPATQSLKKEKIPPLRRESKASPIKARRMSTKPAATLSSDSEVEDTVLINNKDNLKEKKPSTPSQKKDVVTDFIVVPQREAAKKASENLMKTNSALMVQSISGMASEKNRREIREKLDETVMSSKLTTEVERETTKDSKESKLKSNKSSKESKKTAVKDDKSELKKSQKEDKEKILVEKEKEREDKSQSDFAADFPSYVPQRQAAKKAAEHIKGLGNSSQPLPPTVVVDEKSKTSTPVAPPAKKIAVERRKSVAIDLSSSSTSSSSSGSTSGSSSDSESENESPKQPTKPTPLTKASTKSMPSRRPSIAVGPKQKPKDSPFLDKVTKSSVAVKSSSSSSSSDSDSSTSDRPNPSRLPEKGNNSKRKPSEKSQAKKPITVSPKKPTAALKKEVDKPPSRRLSTMVKAQQLPSPSANKTSTSNRSPQKSNVEPPAAPEAPISSRKRSTSTTTPSKVSSNNKSRAVESSKGDLAQLSDKRKPSDDLKETEMNPPITKSQESKKRKTSVSTLAKEVVREPVRKEAEKEKETSLRRSSRSEALSKTAQEKVIEKSQPKSTDSEKEEVKAIIKHPEPALQKELTEIAKEKIKASLPVFKPSPDVIEIMDESENDFSKAKSETPNKLSRKFDEKNANIDVSEMVIDIDKNLVQGKNINEGQQLDVKESVFKVTTPLPSPMVSIPTINLNSIKPTNEVFEEAFNKALHDDNIFNTSNSIFSIPKVTDKEAEERETLSLIEKLRKKDKKTNSAPAPNIAENNNIVNDKMNESPIKLSPCMHQNENKNTPKHDFLEQPTQHQQLPQQQVPTFKTIGSPSVLSKKDQEFNELKKTSPWHQHQSAENNYQRSILTTNNNKINSTLEQPPAPASCMVIEQQQKLAACQKINEENNMLASNRGSNMFMPPMGINMLNEPQNHMEQLFNMQMQQQQQKDQKSLNLKMMQQQQQQANMMKQRNQPGMENMNMINDINQQGMKNSFPQIPAHKGPMTNDFTSAMHPHPMPGNFNSYNFSENTSQNTFTGAVSLFPPNDMNVQVPFPSPGQAMFAPNFANSFTNTPHQSSDHSMMMQGNLHNKVNNAEMMANNLRFGAQNFCNQTPMQIQQQLANNISQSQSSMSQNTNNIHLNRNVVDGNNELLNVSEKPESHKKSPSKSTRSSPRNSTPTHGGKTPQKSPSKSPRQPSTPVSVESLSRQNSQKGKLTPNANETKQRKSRTNSQASPASTPAEHRGKGRGRANKNNKGRFPQANMPFMPFNSGIDYIAINKKLVGTVYDFSADDEFSQAPSVENLRAMRDRTKSVDVFNKLNRDGSSQSPKMTKASIKQSIQHSSLTLNNHALPGDATPLPVAPPIADLNLVNMPGPVDMRTYNSYDNTNDSTYNSQLLGAFASNTVDQTLNDIDEEQEKELQTALKASNDKQKTPTNIDVTETTKSSVEVSSVVDESVDSEASFAKVSLSDSRNQLKLKIKGPLAHPDLHLNATVIPVIPQNVTSGTSNTSSNRRQMRKKELLQQYWNQGMNIDQEQPNAQSVDHQTTSNTSRIGGIPKAVDSMGLGLLKDEFQDFNYAEYKKRKRFALRGVDPHSFDADMGVSNHSDLSNAANEVDPLSLDYNKKRRNRTNRGGQQSNAMGANPPPKLKIKIGSDIMETSGSDLPPKKRHIAAPPSYQDLKRESMNFRKKMMDEFSEQKSKEHRTKEEKREKKEKKKKKKEKKRSAEIVAPVKLILKIGNKSMSTVSNASADNSNSSELSKSAPSLKLKISRNSQGNGEYNILNSKEDKHLISTPKTSPGSTSTIVTSTPISSNNNLQPQPPIIDASDINSITTKKLEISLERIDDVVKAKSLLKKQSEDSIPNDKNSILPLTSKDCEVR
jgi:PHD-zinc-finger like domain